MTKIIVIDGQGGSLGRAVIEQIKKLLPQQPILALGTNSIATAAMLKAGATAGATGENPVLVNCRDADIIIGPVGIIAADALLGEITAAMAAAVGRSPAQKLLIPVNKCQIRIAGQSALPYADIIRLTAEEAVALIAAFRPQ